MGLRFSIRIEEEFDTPLSLVTGTSLKAESPPIWLDEITVSSSQLRVSRFAWLMLET